MFRSRTRQFSRFDTMDSPMDMFNRFIGSHNMQHVFPSFNLWANDDGAVLTSELPGVNMDDLDITVSGKQVTVKGARKNAEQPAEGAQVVRQERMEGGFERSIQLPFNIEVGKVEAKLQNGVLEVTLPRAEIDKPRKITVNV